MALSGARPILIEGTTYRWKFKGHKDNSTRYGGSPRFAHVAIEEAQGPGVPMVAWLESLRWVSDEHHDGDTGSETHKARVTPADIRHLILVALDCGWDPTSKKRFEAPPDIDLTDYRTKQR